MRSWAHSVQELPIFSPLITMSMLHLWGYYDESIIEVCCFVGVLRRMKSKSVKQNKKESKWTASER